jgi:hypothetical protein
VRFDSRTGHAWIRTGKNVDISIPNTDPKLTYKNNGHEYKIVRFTGSVPEGYGFYPAETINQKNPFDLLSPHQGKWIKEHEPGGKEFIVAVYDIPLRGWETKLRKYDSVLEGDDYTDSPELVKKPALFKFGIKKGGCCSTANKESVLSCLDDFVKNNGSMTYMFPFKQCRSSANKALSSCCLELDGELSNVDNGKISIEYEKKPLR